MKKMRVVDTENKIDSNFEIVILHCPYLNIENKLTRDIFSRLIRLKNRGYGNRHKQGSLPLDASDFVADHPLICSRDINGELYPICGSKVITYEICKFFNLEFAMESALKKTNQVLHLDTMRKIIDSANLQNKKIAYHGGYTIDPELRTSEDLTQSIRDMFIGSTALYFKDQNISNLLGLGVPKFKTEKFFYDWGYERCQHMGEDLKEFPLPFLSDISGVMMHLKQFSPFAISMAKKHQDQWEHRTKIGLPFGRDVTEQKKAA